MAVIRARCPRCKLRKSLQSRCASQDLVWGVGGGGVIYLCSSCWRAVDVNKDKPKTLVEK